MIGFTAQLDWTYRGARGDRLYVNILSTYVLHKIIFLVNRKCDLTHHGKPVEGKVDVLYMRGLHYLNHTVIATWCGAGVVGGRSG